MAYINLQKDYLKKFANLQIWRKDNRQLSEIGWM